MNHLKTDPVGIDIAIQAMQVFLYNNLNWSSLEMYGRIYKGKTKANTVTPQAYLSNGEYVKDVFLNDNRNAHVFFIANGTHKQVSGSLFETEVKTVFMLQLDKLFPDVGHRADAEAQLHAFNLMSQRKKYRIMGMETELGDIFKGFDISVIEKLKVHPYDVFSINSKIQYYLNPNC